MTDADKARTIIRLGSSKAARELGIGETTARDLVARHRSDGWYLSLRSMCLRAAPHTTLQVICDTLGVGMGYLREWIKEERGRGARVADTRYQQTKDECLECGDNLPGGGWCSAECAADWIASEGKA